MCHVHIDNCCALGELSFGRGLRNQALACSPGFLTDLLLLALYSLPEILKLTQSSSIFNLQLAPNSIIQAIIPDLGN